MKDVIRLLPDSVANQIAAGEVIQRPASVIKELVENAVDAGAKKIDIIIKDAGRTLIQVVDNGCGMSHTDARLAFERHSTSKIKEASDLFKLHTMGFRGEALASIAAISQIDLRTMQHDEVIGTRLIINGSKVESQEPEVTLAGTNMMVKNLFFNVPARRKFLKKDSVEFSNILREFERLALVNPGIELSISHNDTLIFQLGTASLKQRIGDLFGRNIEDQLVPIHAKTEFVEIDGFIGSPSSAKKRGALEFFFVNGRNMRHPYFHKAVINSFENLLPSDSLPNYFVNFIVEPESIDVNIHPTKNEIKFENEQLIWQILSATVRESLGKFNLGPSIDFDNIAPIDIPAMNSGGKNNYKHNPASKTDINYSPFEDRNKGFDRSHAKEKYSTDNWEKLYENFEKDLTLKFPNEQPSNVSRFMQVGGKYILTPKQNGVTVIDQHRAHVNVLYNRYLDMMDSSGFGSQILLFPHKVDLDNTQTEVLENIIELLEETGFQLNKLGNSQWEITAVPSVLNNDFGEDALKDLLTNLSEETLEEDDMMLFLKKNIFLSLAEHSAIKYGKNLSQEEMEELISSLFSLENPKYTPSGLKVIAEMDNNLLGKVFAN